METGLFFTGSFNNSIFTVSKGKSPPAVPETEFSGPHLHKGSFKNLMFKGVKGQQPLYKPRRVPCVLKTEFLEPPISNIVIIF